MSFDRQMQNAKAKIEKAIEKAVRGAALELFGEIVKRTPVGNPTLWRHEGPRGYIGGTLRGNWQANLRAPLRNVLNTSDSNGSKTASRARVALDAFLLRDKDIWFTNNLPYAERVENGWSKQRPQGMMKVTVKMFRPIMDRIARMNRV